MRLRVISSYSRVPVTRFARTETRLIEHSDMSGFAVTIHEQRATSVQDTSSREGSCRAVCPTGKATP